MEKACRVAYRSSCEICVTCVWVQPKPRWPQHFLRNSQYQISWRHFRLFWSLCIATYRRTDGREILIGAPQGSERAQKGLQVIPSVYISQGRVFRNVLFVTSALFHVHSWWSVRMRSFIYPGIRYEIRSRNHTDVPLKACVKMRTLQSGLL
jgi:hypothetical protein